MLQIRGDPEFLVQAFCLRSMASNKFCWLCEAEQNNDGPMTYRDFRPNAHHRATAITHEMYFEACAAQRRDPSELFQVPGLTIEHLCIDAMHSAHLGTFPDAIGSLFYAELHNRTWYRNKEAGLAALNRMLADYFKANEDKGVTKLGPLVYSQILSDSNGFPTLKAKAAQAKHVSLFCLLLAERHAAGNDEYVPFSFSARHPLAGQEARHCQLVVDLFRGMNDFNESCSEEPFDRDRCCEAMLRYLHAHGELHKMWKTAFPGRAHLPWHLRPKAHECQHLVQDQLDRFGSPALTWCFRDEDFIGVVKHIARRSLHPATIEDVCLNKLRLFAALDVA
jgi:hypothetical protein